MTSIDAIIPGVSTATAAKWCAVDDKTAFRWRHRFLASLAGDKPRTSLGIVEGDETFIAGNVFLGVHGVEGEQASGQAEGCDHLLGGPE